MKGAVLACVTVVAVFGIICGTISYNAFINRNKEHVYTDAEVYAIECAKRGGNPTIKDGRDWAGEQSVDLKEYKCEGATDVRN